MQDTLLDFFKGHGDRKSIYSISKKSLKLIRELSVPAIQPAEIEVNNTYAGKQADEDQGKTHRWLKAAGLEAETEEFIIAAQDQSFSKP